MGTSKLKGTKSTVSQTTGWAWDRADCNLVFKANCVVEYGAGEVRPKSPGVVMIIPARF